MVNVYHWWKVEVYIDNENYFNNGLYNNVTGLHMP